MAPSSKRPQRTRREPANNMEVADSSPSRPAKRRKKVEEHVEPPKEENLKLPLDRSGLNLDDEEIVRAVVPHLHIPQNTPVQATKDHSNTLHEKHSAEGVTAYAKLAGKEWTFYVKELRNMIGRAPEKSTGSPNSTKQEDRKYEPVHIDLGPSKTYSRNHAAIFFDADAGRWKIEALGRNGVRIDFQNMHLNEKRLLINGQVVEIGGVEMMFCLPEDEGCLQVHPRLLRRAGLIEGEDKEDDIPVQVFSSDPSSQTPARGQNGVPGALPIAPAPPDYRRAGTPPNARGMGSYAMVIPPPYASGTVFMNSENVDLSLDANKLVKPPFSYAQMISQAILDTKEEKLNLNGIYTYITERFAYYRHQSAGGWQNSIRHNLSLNKSFIKVPRSSDEPGKGMKWCITPESREEMFRNSQRGGRGGHRGSSLPGSPANLDNLRAYPNNGATSSASRPVRPSPPAQSPGFSSSAQHFTPDRRGHLLTALGDTPGDGSPLPPHKRIRNYGMSDNMTGSPPAFSPSYNQDESSSFATPAPHRVHPRLAPPSTAQRPSQVMPTSSPAPFWKYADLGGTPMKAPAFASSPIKESALPAVPPSSSPPPIPRRSIASPSRVAPAVTAQMPSVGEIEEESGGFDLTRGFQSISSFHAAPANGIPITSASTGRS